MLIPRDIAPALVVETLSGTPYDLSLEKPARFSLVCFYRGLHCPVCSNYLRELDRLTPAFGERGVTTVAISVEPPLFSEPGVFLLTPDQSIYYISVQSMPFVRPNFQEMVQALDFIISTDYPARGEYIGAV